jgi:tripartite-type tricarboxylate transporter receptor subunit TctC
MARNWLKAILLLLVVGTAQAQYPSRPIRLLVPNPPGGATDSLARIMAPGLAQALGQPVIVDNRPGSNGNLATELTARAAPDGHTLLLCTDAQIVIGPHLYAKMPVDPLKDLVPIATLANTSMVLSVLPSLPVKNLQEFIEYARRSNPPLAYASIGNGSLHHLVMEMFKQRAGIDLLHVPYKGGGPATVALLGGEVAAMFGGNSVAGHIRSGRLRGLAVAGKERSSAYPELPRLGEHYPGLEANAWLALCGPAGVPAATLSRLRSETRRLLTDSETLQKLRGLGEAEPYITTPEEFAAQIRSEYAKYGEIVKAVGAKID